MDGTIELLCGLLLLMVVLVGLARRFQIPYPIFLVIGGLAIGLIPGLPHVELEPELVFLIFLPPILTSAGFFTPLRDFRFNLRSILLLAVGLVLFTTAMVALVVRMLVPEMPWAAAFALGAIVAPPDAIAATSVAQRLNLPRRIITVLEGESLVNDASALVAYRVAVAAAVTGAFSFGEAALDFVVASAGGIAIGLAISWVTAWILARIDDTPVEVIITFLGSFLAYLAAEALHVSGVLAAVMQGLYLGRRSARVMSSRTRVQGQATWESVIFAINGLVFVLIGLQLPAVLASLSEAAGSYLLALVVAVALTVIVCRFVWVFPGAYLPRFLSARIRANDPYPSWRNVVVVGYAGMRGIVSLAAALALPAEFPFRDLIIFLTFGVILATLVGQGLTLPYLIRALRVVDDGGAEREENKARWVAAKAGLARLDELEDEEWVRAEHVSHLREHYAERVERFRARYQRDDATLFDGNATELVRLQQALLVAEMEAIIRLRDQGYINDEVLRQVQRELDFEQLRLANGQAEVA